MESAKEEVSRLQIVLPRALHDRLKILAVRKGKNVSDILREFIEWYVEREEKA